MNLFLYDTEKDNPKAGSLTVDYDYQAEMWVKDSSEDPRACKQERWVICWELEDSQGVRARWERPDQSPGVPKLTWASDRYTGEWRVGH